MYNDTDRTRQIDQIPDATSMVASARRADRKLFAIVGVAAAALSLGAIVMLGPDRTTTADAPIAPVVTQAPPPTQVTPVAPVAVAVPPVVDVAEPGDVVAPEPEPSPDPQPEPEPPAEVPDPGEPDPDEPEVNPCMVAADAGRTFFAPSDVVLDAGVLGGSFRIGSCSAAPFAVELSTVPGVLLSHSTFDLQPGGTDVLFMVVPEFFEDHDIEFDVEILEVACCAQTVHIVAEKTFDLGVLAPFDPGTVSLLTERDGIDPLDPVAVTDQFIAEYGFHPSYLDSPEGVLHGSALSAFIEQFDLQSPWIDADS